jgi:hypothetical protein
LAAFYQSTGEKEKAVDIMKDSIQKISEKSDSDPVVKLQLIINMAESLFSKGNF